MSKKLLKKKVTELEKALSEFDLSKEFKKIRETIEKLKEESPRTQAGELRISDEWKNLSNTLFLFTDGACRGNPGPGAWAYVIQDKTEKVLFQKADVSEVTTNNQMEMRSVIEGLEKILLENPLSQGLSVYLSSDSQYVINGMTTWMQGWKKRGWKKADNKAPENVELWKKLDNLIPQFKKIEYFWVKGHAGHPQNELCDEIANKALDEAGF